MMGSRKMLLELEWYEAGDVYFSFSLSGAADAITKARALCQASDIEASYDVRLIQSLLQESGIEPGPIDGHWGPGTARRSEEHTSELQSLMRSSYAVFCLKKKKYDQ